MAERSPGSVLWQLFLACLNATLILAALCLWLGWRMADTLQGVTENMVVAAVEALPLREDVGALHDEIESLRADLSEVGNSVSSLVPLQPGIDQARLEEINVRLTELSTAMKQFVEDPHLLIDTAIDATSMQVKGFVSDMRNCHPPITDSDA